MPQMLVVEALAQSSGALCHYSGLMRDIEKPLIFFAGFDKCRFLGSASAGQSLVLECHLIRAMRDVIKVAGTASVDGAADPRTRTDRGDPRHGRRHRGAGPGCGRRQAARRLKPDA